MYFRYTFVIKNTYYTYRDKHYNNLQYAPGSSTLLNRQTRKNRRTMDILSYLYLILQLKLKTP